MRVTTPVGGVGLRRVARWLWFGNALLAVAWLGMMAAHLGPRMGPTLATLMGGHTVTVPGPGRGSGSTEAVAGSGADPAGSSQGVQTSQDGEATPAFPPPGRWAWPLSVSAGVTSPFGPRGSGWHHGVDLAAPAGTPVLAVWDGVVRQAGWRGAYGLTVEVEHPGGWRSLYGHLSQLAVAAGQPVNRGDLLGRVGETGNATGPHLHLEVRAGNGFYDPLRWFPQRTLSDVSPPAETSAVRGGS